MLSMSSCLTQTPERALCSLLLCDHGHRDSPCAALGDELLAQVSPGLVESPPNSQGLEEGTSLEREKQTGPLCFF